jgi:glycerol-3-phosphate O-acyltransferase
MAQQLVREGVARGPIDERKVIEDITERISVRLGKGKLDLLINDCCYLEIKRLKRAKTPSEDPYFQLLMDARRRLAFARRDELDAVLRDIVRHYVAEIHGHFDPKFYARVSKILPMLFAVLLKGQDPTKIFKGGLRSGLKQGLKAGLSTALAGTPDLSDRIVVSGELETFQGLVHKGTCVLVPTHLSNLDSPVVGFALHAAELPPMIYGAGINLFSNWLLSYFMDHLGAYRVDRMKKAVLYKEVLKEYSAYAIEQRWHSLFFPGGTRSRSGKVEAKLKKGLMGTALAAYQGRLRAGLDKERVFFVPCTLNYHLVLEAETLIDDSLQESGKSRYIILDDEFSQRGRVASYVRNMLALDNPIEVVFGAPLDPFGNPVNADGDSLDPQGRAFDPRGYVMENGEVVTDTQRDREYTGRLADSIARSLQRNTILFDTHVLAAAMLRRIEARHPKLDLFRRLLLPLDERRIRFEEVDAELEHLLAALRGLAARGEVRLGSVVAKGTAEEVRLSGGRHLARYHARKAIQRDDAGLTLGDPRLALYYANRLAGYPLPPPLPRGAGFIDRGVS